MPDRTNIHVDGFNLYYGAISNDPYKWLNLERYFKLLRNKDDIQRIHYFTALVDGARRSNQLAYLAALETLPLVTITYGKFKNKQVRCQVPKCLFTGSRMFVTQEEKRTDANIALQILHDAYEDNCDLFVIISGDSDLVPAVSRVR